MPQLGSMASTRILGVGILGVDRTMEDRASSPEDGVMIGREEAVAPTSDLSKSDGHGPGKSAGWVTNARNYFSRKIEKIVNTPRIMRPIFNLMLEWHPITIVRGYAIVTKY